MIRMELELPHLAHGVGVPRDVAHCFPECSDWGGILPGTIGASGCTRHALREGRGPDVTADCLCVPYAHAHGQVRR